MGATMKKHTKLRIWMILVFVHIMLVGCSNDAATKSDVISSQNPQNVENLTNEGSFWEELTSEEKSELLVHFIDVGQGDSILIESDEEYMLIDAGENDMGERVVNYLKSVGVTKLSYVIGTHPHSDHIGGLDDVIRAFDVDKVILPDKEHTTKTFEDVLDAVIDKGLKLTKPVVGETYTIGKASFCIIAPNADYGDNLNNWSVGIKLIYQDTSFLMYGDAEKIAEQDMLNNGIDLSADVLKLSHHGSSTSSIKQMIEAISPAIAIIEVGEGNSYGHPHQEILDLLKNQGITVYRTDELGTILVYSDGENLKIASKKIQTPQVVTKPESTEDKDVFTEQGGSEDNTEIYVLNNNTKKFHTADCPSTDSITDKNKAEVETDREELIKQGYSPCKTCNP